MTNNNRPLSPFMLGSLYKPQLTSMLSILHRITGAALAVGLVLLTWFLFAVLAGEHAFSIFRDFKESIIGQVLLFGWLFSFVYHFFNGLRHLAWDLVLGFDLKTTYITGYLVVICSIVATIAIWMLGAK